MKLIVGLGNPGRKYAETRHNIGFITMDEWAHQHQEAFSQENFEGQYLERHSNGEKVFFLKPQTYMNESGRAVGAFLHYYQILPEELLVVYDDLDLPVGQLRLRQKGGAGGHNGMRSIISHVGSDQFKRIRLGIGRPPQGMTVPNYVLSRFRPDEHTAMLKAVQDAREAIDYWLGGASFENTMSQFNHH